MPKKLFSRKNIDEVMEPSQADERELNIAEIKEQAIKEFVANFNFSCLFDQNNPTTWKEYVPIINLIVTGIIFIRVLF